AAKDLDALSRKGHFLKGSSAALGLQRVQHSCEAMQHFGKRRDARGEGPEVAEDEALNRCRVLLVRLKKEQAEAKEWLEAFYKDSASA
ncbi:Ypd1p, partial [Rhodotorula paludigena]